MAKFFIDRPVFAWVLAIVLMGAGLLSIRTMPVSQYPSIASPQVQISAFYPGASAEVLQSSVAQIIEQELTGIDYVRYFETSCDSSGNVTITVTFENEADPDIAQVQVQNKVSTATPFLPQEVRNLGVRVRKSVRNFLVVYSMHSEDGSLNRDDIADYIYSNLKEPINRIEGVGDVLVFGSEYAMRVWLNPEQMTNYNISVADIRSALIAQNAEIAAGQFGNTPTVPGQRLNASITFRSRLKSIEEFENVLLRVNPDGSRVLLSDVARISLGSESSAIEAFSNGKESSGFAIRPSTGANALKTVGLINKFLESQKEFFPEGLVYKTSYDTSPFVELSIHEVIKTLIEAIVLVFLVMLLFLGNLRATFIPTVAVPVVLLGTFAIMEACGFTINTLTLFGLVLAIGLLVDDAIVVVENVERLMTEEDLPPREATRKSMDQITGALVAIAVVLSAVFIPMAFFKGATGIIYRQFSITIASAMGLSVFVALTLTPALCASMLRPMAHHELEERKGFLGWFNRTFNRTTQIYGKGVGSSVKRWGRSILVYICITVGMGFIFMRLPTSFLPEEDQGVLAIQVLLPAGATLDQTIGVLEKVENYFLENEKEAVESVMNIAGISFAGRAQNAGFGFVKLKEWDERKGADLRVDAIAMRAMRHFATFEDGVAYAFPPPAIVELGTANGFEFRLLDKSNFGHESLMNARGQLLGLANTDPGLFAVRPNGFEDVPAYEFTIDEGKAASLGVPMALANNTMSAAWGSSYINDFKYRGRIKKVYMQADAPYRTAPESLEKWYVPGMYGNPIAITEFAEGSWHLASPLLERFNGLPSIAIQGSAAPGKSSGDAMNTMEKLMDKLPKGFSFAWTGLSYEEKIAGAQAPALYAISIIVVFLCLAALYESWSVPIAVILVVPLGVIGAVFGVWLRGLHNDIYFQVGLITTVGLSAKNAILIVAFAKQAYEEGGRTLVEAAIYASKQRLRPIIMTSLAFGLGVLPLAISSGAGSGSQNAIGTGVLGGMITATILAIFLVPVFFVLVNRIFRGRRKNPSAQ